jgi:hypothetical protein
MKSSDSNKSTSSNWILSGFVCLLVGGAIATQALLSVDNDLEINTKFRGQSWQVNLQSLRKYTTEIGKFTERELSQMGVILRQQSTQLLTRTNGILTVHRDWCVPIPEFSTVLAQAKQLNPLESDRSTLSETDRPREFLTVKQTAHRPSPDRILPPHPPNSDRAVSNWCFTTGTEK